jgi:hypothetical protein
MRWTKLPRKDISPQGKQMVSDRTSRSRPCITAVMRLIALCSGSLARSLLGRNLSQGTLSFLKEADEKGDRSVLSESRA